MWAWLKLIRIVNVLLIGGSQVCVLLHLFTLHQIHVTAYYFIAFTLLATAGGFIINDYFDVETDSINKPHRLLISKHISKTKAKSIYLVITLICIVLAITIANQLQNYYFLILELVILLLLYTYSHSLKGKFLIGNLLIATFTSCTILLFLWILPYNQQQLHVIYVFSFFAFFMNLLREIIKDLEDIIGDKKAGLKTMPILIGTQRTLKICKILVGYILFSFLLVMYFVTSIYFKVYILCFLTTPILYCMVLLNKKTKKNVSSRISKILKLVILFGILSVFFT